MSSASATDPVIPYAMENSSGRYSAALVSSLDPGTESLPPARVPRLPAEFLSSLFVRGPTRSGHLGDDELSGKQPPYPGRYPQRRLRARELCEEGQPLRDGRRVVVHDVVNARLALLHRSERRSRRVGDLDKRPDPGPVADHRHLTLAHHTQQNIRGARPVEAAVAQHESFGNPRRNILLDMLDRRLRAESRPDRLPVERIFLGLQRAAGRLIRPWASVALGNKSARARLLGGGQQVVGAAGAEVVGDGEQFVRITETPHARQRGHLVQDHLRRRGSHCRDHRLAIEPVEHDRFRARRAQLRDLARRSRGSSDVMTSGDQPRNEVPPEGTSRAGDEDSHDHSFPLVLSLLDKTPGDAVTLTRIRRAKRRPPHRAAAGADSRDPAMTAEPRWRPGRAQRKGGAPTLHSE